MSIINIIRNIFCGALSCPDTDYLIKQIESLTRELSHCIGSVDIIEEYQTEINPHTVIKGYDMVIADAKYLTYKIEDWKSIMYRLHRHLGSKLKYGTNVSDCDNFALLYASTLAHSAYRAGLSKQIAFCIIWSSTHAYNGFITSDGDMFLYEPQTGDIIGKIDADNGDMYNSKKIWFLG